MPKDHLSNEIIRRLTVDDLDSFRLIRAEALRRYPQTFGSPVEEQGGEPMLVAYRDWLSGTIIGAFDREALVGIAGFYVAIDKRSRHRGHIYTVYVRDEMQGRGVGDRLVKELLAFASTKVEQVHLAVLVTATPAITLYKNNGFEIYGTDPNVRRIGQTSYDEYLMIKKLPPI
jgi:ribosomal protein S18 acetylase RimI-like enzyme